jgi:hypothetical protein
MITGNGMLVLGDGRRIPLNYQFAADYDDQRAGYLFCDIATIDPAAFLGQIKVICDDGTSLIVAITHHSDKYLAVAGRVFAREDAA